MARPVPLPRGRLAPSPTIAAPRPFIIPRERPTRCLNTMTPLELGDPMIRRRFLILMIFACITGGEFVALRPARAHNPDPNDPLELACPILKVADVPKA